jgi:Protein of unknown function (DUF6044)
MNESRLRRVLRWTVDFIERYPILVFMIWAAICSYEYWLFGNLSYVRIDDNADSTLAAKLGLAHDITQYGFTWWWDTTMSGADNVALAVVSELDTLPFLILPGWLAYGLNLFVQRFIAGYFMYRLMRETLDLRLLTGLYAAMAFALFAQNWLLDSWNGYTLYHGLALPGIPLILWALYRVTDKTGWKQWLLAASLGAFAAISGYFVFMFFVIPFVLYWLVAVNRIPIRKLFNPAAVFVFFWALFEFPAQLPALLNAGLSHRAEWSFSDQPWDTALFYLGRMAADNYLALTLAVLALLFGFLRHKRLGWMMLLLPAIGTIMALKPAIAGFTEQYLGFIRGVQFDRVYLFLPFLVVVLGAVALDAFFAWKDDELKGNAIAHRFRNFRAGTLITVSLTVVIVLLSGFAFVKNERKMFQQLAIGMNYSALYQHPGINALEEDAEGDTMFRAATVSTWNNRLDAKASSYSMIPFNTANLWARNIQTADGYVLLYPQRYRQLWSEVLAPRYPKTGRDHSQFHIWGGKAYLFFPSDSLQVHAQEFSFESYYNLNILSLLNVRYIVSNFRHPDSSLRPVWDGSDDLKRWEHIPRGMKLLTSYFGGNQLFNPLWVYENPSVLPRYYAASGLRRFATREELLDALGRASLEEIHRNAFVVDEDFPGNATDMSFGEGSVRILEYTPDKSRFRIQSDSGCVFVASASYSPYWEAEIDGQSTEIFPAYLGLQGLVVPAGEHVILLRYRPPYAL